MILEDKRIKTRIDHQCFGCLENIPAGSTAGFIKEADTNDGIFNSYWCERCYKFLNSLDHWQRQDGFMEGELKECEGYPK